MIAFQKIATVAAVGAASYTSASPVKKVEHHESRSFGALATAFETQAWKWNAIAPWLHASLSKSQWGCGAPGLPSWNGGDKARCFWFFWTSFCRNGNPPKPTPSGCQGGGPVCQDGYQQVFTNYQTTADSGVYQGQTVGAATIDNENYLTYILVSDADKCLTACDQTSGCVFVNLYQDNASQASDVSELPQSAQSKYTKGNLTCAMYKACSDSSKATNYGGQQDPTFITNSNGYCKGGKCQ